MRSQQSHEDPSVSSGTSPGAQLTAEELHEFSLAMQAIFDNELPAPAVVVEAVH